MTLTLTAGEIDTVRRTFALLKPKAHVAALAFYQRLFTLDPGLRPLFRNDIEAQSVKLMTMIEAATQALDQPANFIPMLTALGRRHVDYGVRPEHYATVGDALIWMLRATLVHDFTPEARAAWTSLYAVITDAMLTGAAQPAHGQPSPQRT